jgi:hypothetical protein
MDHANTLPDGISIASEHRYHEGIPPPSYQATVRAKSTLDLTSRMERKFAQYNASQNVFKRWLFEILSVAISAICMGKEDCTKVMSIKLTCYRSHYCDTSCSQEPTSWEMASWTYCNHNSV